MKYDPANGQMCFSNALKELKRGQRVARLGWAEPQELRVEDGVLVTRLATDEEFPWFPVQADLLAEDWVQLV